MTTIIDYNAGNLQAIANMLSYLGYKSRIARSGEELIGASKIIIPGVGHFDYGMRALKEVGFVEPLTEMVIEEKVPLLGICLGAQILTRGSAEGSMSGLGWIPADTVAFDRSKLTRTDRIPHIGWAETSFRASSPLATDLTEDARFYYVHSFHIRCDYSSHELCHTVHGYQFTAGIEHNNIVAVQFHPEKSHRFGMQVLRNFIELY